LLVEQKLSFDQVVLQLERSFAQDANVEIDGVVVGVVGFELRAFAALSERRDVGGHGHGPLVFEALQGDVAGQPRQGASGRVALRRLKGCQ
jgi:hypothetical protein